MKSKEKLINALEHKTGELPVDFGSTAVTGIHCSCVEKLRDYYGLEKHPIKIIEPYQMLGFIEDDLKEAMGIDTTCIFSPKTMFGFRNENWKEFKTPWNQAVLVGEKFNTKNEGGNLYIYPEGDYSVEPSGHLPEGGYFFDTVIRQEPFDEDKLDYRDNTEEFGSLKEEDLEYFRKEAEKVSSSPRAVATGMPGTAFGDIAMVPAPFLKKPKGIRDVSEWYMSTAIRQDYVHKVFDYQCETALENLPEFYKAVGNSIDILFMCGTDFGTQSSTFCSLDTFEELYAPYYKKINKWVHENTPWKTFKHSCGAIEPFLGALTDAGFDIINPVQCSATGMEPEKIKEKYGDRLVFWGGGVDTQKTLPFGSPEQVRKEVLSRCEIFSKGGGFVFNSIHNVQALTPVENIVAMLEAVKEFNGQ